MLFYYKEHPGKKWFASNLLALLGKLAMVFLYRVKLIYPPDLKINGPILVLAKHSIEIDIPLGYYSMLVALGRHAWCIMKASLARSRYLGFYWKIGGIPLDRENPEKSKHMLVYARKILYNLDQSGLQEGNGNIVVLFPEETTYWQTMGEGQTGGFRFIVGKPQKPLNVVCVGFRYTKGFIRTNLEIEFGPMRQFTKDDDHAVFLHERMCEIAQLSNLDYPFPTPKSRAKTLVSA